VVGAPLSIDDGHAPAGGNVCDPNYTVVCKVRKEWVPDRAVMGGTRAGLKDMGAAYLAERR
jgi:hypothetical protein